MSFKQLLLTAIAMVVGVLAPLQPAFAEQTAGEKVEKAGRDAKTRGKKAARKLEDKTCEMVNGKLECVGAKVKNKSKNASDKVEDAVKDTADKVD